MKISIAIIWNPRKDLGYIFPGNHTLKRWKVGWKCVREINYLHRRTRGQKLVYDKKSFHFSQPSLPRAKKNRFTHVYNIDINIEDDVTGVLWKTGNVRGICSLVHTKTHQVMQNRNKLTVDCTGTSYKTSSGNNSLYSLICSRVYAWLMSWILAKCYMDRMALLSCFIYYLGGLFLLCLRYKQGEIWLCFIFTYMYAIFKVTLTGRRRDVVLWNFV